MLSLACTLMLFLFVSLQSLLLSITKSHLLLSIGCDLKDFWYDSCCPNLPFLSDIKYHNAAFVYDLQVEFGKLLLNFQFLQTYYTILQLVVFDPFLHLDDPF